MQESLELEEIRCDLSALVKKVETAISNKPLLVDVEAAAGILNLSAAYLNQLRKGLMGPKYVKIGASVRYSPEDLEKWVKEQKRHG